MRRVAAVLWIIAAQATGCDRVLGLEPPPDADSGCWDMSQLLEDEDEDAVVDGCDNCPIDRNGMLDSDNQRDGDGDGVGDACDPHPIRGIDRLAFFDPLREVSAERWDTSFGGDWAAETTPDGRGMRQQEEIPHALAWLRRDVAFRVPTVMVLLREHVGNAGAQAGVFVMPGAAAALPADGIACSQRLAPDELVLFEQVDTQTLTVQTKQFGGPGTHPVRLTLEADVLDVSNDPITAKETACKGRRTGSGSLDVITTKMMTSGLEGTVGLWTKDAKATFLSVLVIETPI